MKSFYDYDSNRLYFESRDGITFDISLIERIVMIIGESATGKTLLTQGIKNYQKSCYIGCIAENKLENIIIYDKNIQIKDDKVLYIMDRGDTYLNDKLCDEIVSTRHARFLIFARGAYPLYIHPRCLGDFIEDGNNIKVVYAYDGWW